MEALEVLTEGKIIDGEWHDVDQDDGGQKDPPPVSEQPLPAGSRRAPKRPARAARILASLPTSAPYRHQSAPLRCVLVTGVVTGYIARDQSFRHKGLRASTRTMTLVAFRPTVPTS